MQWRFRRFRRDESDPAKNVKLAQIKGVKIHKDSEKWVSGTAGGAFQCSG